MESLEVGVWNNLPKENNKQAGKSDVEDDEEKILSELPSECFEGW